MKFLADENFPRLAVLTLRNAGFDVVWIAETDPGIPDEEVLALGVSMSRILLTFDKDFGELAYRWGLPAVCGIILFRINPQSPDLAAALALTVLRSQQSWIDHFSVVATTGIRIRSLPGRQLPRATRNLIMTSKGPPHDAPIFSAGMHLAQPDAEQLQPSGLLSDLLFDAREQYSWKSTTPAGSQMEVIRLETEIADRLKDLTADNAQWIVQEVSRWGGNNERSIGDIAAASSEQKRRFAELISQLLEPSSILEALRLLAGQPGVDLVMASKVYRFCCPQAGASVDRHSSYFFNSLSVRDETGDLRPCTEFRREWKDGKHQVSRLASYSDSGRERNLTEYCSTYLPRLRMMADTLNSQRGGFICAASGRKCLWRPADVEMAAYHWWSRNAPHHR